MSSTVDSIYLLPTQNIQAGHEGMDLASGQVITSGFVTEMRIKCNTEAVEKMGNNQGYKNGLKIANVLKSIS